MSSRARCLLTAVLTLAAAGAATAKPHVRIGGFSVGAGYVSGYPYYSPFFYDPLFYGFAPFYYPGYFTGFAYQPSRGEVKLPFKTGGVFIDGAYAGEVHERKSIWLDPGAYDLEVRDGSRSIYNQRIYVLSGKTLKIRAGQIR